MSKKNHNKTTQTMLDTYAELRGIRKAFEQSARGLTKLAEKGCKKDITPLLKELQDIKKGFIASAESFKHIDKTYGAILCKIGGSCEIANREGITIPKEIDDDNFAGALAAIVEMENKVVALDSCISLIKSILKTRASIISKHKKISKRIKATPKQNEELTAIIGAQKRIAQAKNTIDARYKSVLEFFFEIRNKVLQQFIGRVEMLTVITKKTVNSIPEDVLDMRLTQRLCSDIERMDAQLKENSFSVYDL